ncbi:unnamed protein product [Dicrocoelium dendriticum]|nr:unnamed protein product [Dicrocoelium dendriticum]
MDPKSDILSSNPLIKANRGGKQPIRIPASSKKLKAAQQLLRKLKHSKNALRLVTCEFDQQFLHSPGLLGAFTPKLEVGWQSCTINLNESGFPDLDASVSRQLPPLIRPTDPAVFGRSGPVPISNSFTWTRCEPRLVSESEEDPTILLEPVSEPEVVVLLTTDQTKKLLEVPRGSGSSRVSTLDSFGSCLKQLGRPVTCIFLTGVKLRGSSRKRTSGSSVPLSLNQLCAKLQITWGISAIRICNTVEDVALVLAAYTRSISERPFKEGRLSRDEGLCFLPDTIRAGLAGCASRGRGAGPAPASPVTGKPMGTDSRALYAWANRVWLSQLGQWRGVTGEIAHAITQSYPTARAFFHACHTRTNSTDNDHMICPSSRDPSGQRRPHPLESKLADLEIRRGAGVLASTRRLGPELARRLILYFTTDDPNFVIE